MIKLKSLLRESPEEEDDGYYYHVTLAPYVPLIQSKGLKVGSKSTVTNYKEYSRGKIFFCDIGALNWWVWKIAEHAFHNFDDERYHNVAVFRVLKANLGNVEIDKEGSDDSRAPAYCVRHDVPANVLEFVKIVEEPY